MDVPFHSYVWEEQNTPSVQLDFVKINIFFQIDKSNVEVFLKLIKGIPKQD